MRFTVIAFIALGIAGCDRGPRPPEGSRQRSAEASQSQDMAASPHAPSPMEANPHAANPHAAGPAAPSVAPTGAVTVSRTAPELAGLRWDAPDPLTWQAPSNEMRAAEYVVSDGEAQALLTVSHFPGMGGRVSDNIARWVGQLRRADGAPLPESEVHIETKNVHGMTLTTVDASGTYVSGMGGPGGENYRMLGAIVEGPSGPVFFKMIGPRATMERAEGAFETLLSSLEPVS